MASSSKTAATLVAGPRGPRVSLPPTIVFVSAFLGAVVVHLRAPLRLVEAPFAAIGAALGVLAIAFGLWLFAWAWRTLAGARTGIMFQHAATRIVETGPYRWTRNPMYVAFAAVYAGASLVGNTLWPLVILPAVVVLVEHFVIGREERYLRRTFGDEYAAYCRRVGRWGNSWRSSVRS